MATITRMFLARTASLSLFVINTLLLLVYHAYANSPANNSGNSNEPEPSNNNNMWQRLWTGGPANLNQPLDKVLMAALVAL